MSAMLKVTWTGQTSCGAVEAAELPIAYDDLAQAEARAARFAAVLVSAGYTVERPGGLLLWEAAHAAKGLACRIAIEVR